MSFSDDDDVVYFQYNTLKCIKKDKVSAQSVQKLFNLDYAIEKVELVSKNRRIVDIEDVEINKRYRIQENSVIPNHKQHISNAIYASQAIYKDCPNEYLNETTKCHSITRVCDITRYSPQRVMLAVSQNQEEHKTLYVAYRGTVDYSDMLVDIDCDMVSSPSLRRSKCHKGFLQRSKKLSSGSIFKCAQYYKVKNVVFCGHSLGAAVASLSAIHFMQFLSDSKDELCNTTYCITFGTPFYGNKQLGIFCKDSKFSNNFVNVTQKYDVIPTLLSIGNTVNCLIKNTPPALQSVVKYCKQYSSYLHLLHKVTQKTITKPEILAITLCLREISTNALKLGDDYRDSMYLPIGNYLLLEQNDSFSIFKQGSVTNQVIDYVLQHAMEFQSLDDILRNHDLENYMDELSKKNISIRNSENIQKVFSDSFYTLKQEKVESKAKWTHTSVTQGNEYWNFELILTLDGYIDFITYDDKSFKSFKPLSKPVKTDYQYEVSNFYANSKRESTESTDITIVTLSAKHDFKISLEHNYLLRFRIKTQFQEFRVEFNPQNTVQGEALYAADIARKENVSMVIKKCVSRLRRMKALDGELEKSGLFEPLVELIQAVGQGGSVPGTGALRRTGSLGSSTTKLFDTDCDEDKLSQEILAEILKMADDVIDYLKSSDYDKYLGKLMSSPLPFWAKATLRLMIFPLVLVYSAVVNMIGTSSNDFEMLKIALVESRRLEEVDKYYVKKLAEIGMLLSRYCNYLKLDVFLSAGHIPNFYVFVTPYNGTPDTVLIQNILHACTMKQLAGKYCDVVFCLNKAYTALNEHKQEGKQLLNFNERKEIDKAKIQEYIQEKFEEEARNSGKRFSMASRISILTNLEDLNINEKRPASTTSKYSTTMKIEALKEHLGAPDYDDILHCLQEIEIFYTDWKDYEKEDAVKSGIVGPDFIKYKLKEFARKHDLIF